MWRGTTPTHTFTLPPEIRSADFENIYITYSQNGEVVLEKTGSELNVSDAGIQLTLSQEDTLKFKSGQVKIQLRARLKDGQAVASNIICTTAKEVLKDGVI